MSGTDWAHALAAGGDARLARRIVALSLSDAAGPYRQRKAALARLSQHGEAPPGLVLADLERFARGRGTTSDDVDRAGRRLVQLGARLVLMGEPDYPRRLAQLWPELGAPLWLFVRGLQVFRLDPPAAVAVVGSRHPSFDGLDMAEELGRLLGRAGVTVVSGMARGIDEAAHRGALAVGGRTVAVLGTGFGVDYPRGRHALRDEIAASGGLVTELPPDRGPRGHQFLDRNRVVSGLVDAVVVVEGRARSGALATARLAAEQGREVWAVPGSPTQPTARAPLDLIRDSARPLTRLDDVLDGLGPAPVGSAAHGPAGHAGPAAVEPAPGRSGAGGRSAVSERSGTRPPASRGGPAAPDGPLRAVADALTAVPASADALRRATDLPLPTVLAALTELTALGLARTTPRGWVAGGRA